MKMGNFLHNNWLLGALAVTLLAAIAISTTVSGQVSVELAGVMMSLEQHENGGVRVFFVQAP